jgi:hypothetical protein
MMTRKGSRPTRGDQKPPRKGTVLVNVRLLKEIIKSELITHAEVAERAGWFDKLGERVTANLRRALKGKPLTLKILRELAKALDVKPIRLLLADSKATYDDVVRCRCEPVQLPPPSTTLHCHGRIHELHALRDDGRVEELTKPCHYGEFENATLTIRRTAADRIDADLSIDDVTIYADSCCSKELFSGRLQGNGSGVDDSVNIRYAVTEQDQTRGRSWSGVCVLSVPKVGKIHDGKIHGYWMTAGHIAKGRTVLGTLELEPRAAKSAKEADGHIVKDEFSPCGS